MTTIYANDEPRRIEYMPLPDLTGTADVRLHINIEQVEDEDGNPIWTADETVFRAEMTLEYVEAHFDELLDYVPPVPESDPTTEGLLLEIAADHEMRLCLIELGV